MGQRGRGEQGVGGKKKQNLKTATLIILAQSRVHIMKGGCLRGVQGSIRWANGDEYVGEFKQGMRHGQGVFTTQKGRHR